MIGIGTSFTVTETSELWVNGALIAKFQPHLSYRVTGLNLEFVTGLDAKGKLVIGRPQENIRAADAKVRGTVKARKKYKPRSKKKKD